MDENRARIELSLMDTDTAAIICTPFFVVMQDGLFSVVNRTVGSTGYGENLERAIRECCVGILMRDPRRLHP